MAVNCPCPCPCNAPRLSGRLCCASFVALCCPLCIPFVTPLSMPTPLFFFPPVFVLRNLLSPFYNKCNPSTPSDHAHCRCCCCCCCNKKVLPLDAGQRNPFCAQHEGGGGRRKCRAWTANDKRNETKQVADCRPGRGGGEVQ